MSIKDDHKKFWPEMFLTKGTVLDIDPLGNAYVMIDGWKHFIVDHRSLMTPIDATGADLGDTARTGDRVLILVERDTDETYY